MIYVVLQNQINVACFYRRILNTDWIVALVLFYSFFSFLFSLIFASYIFFQTNFVIVISDFLIHIFLWYKCTYINAIYMHLNKYKRFRFATIQKCCTVCYFTLEKLLSISEPIIDILLVNIWHFPFLSILICITLLNVKFHVF